MEVTIQQISKAVMPMIAASVAVLLLITYVPQISTFLPKALAKDGAYTGTVAAATNFDTPGSDGADSSTMELPPAMRITTILPITVTLDGKSRPGTLPAPPLRPVPGQEGRRKVSENW